MDFSIFLVNDRNILYRLSSSGSILWAPLIIEPFQAFFCARGGFCFLVFSEIKPHTAHALLIIKFYHGLEHLRDCACSVCTFLLHFNEPVENVRRKDQCDCLQLCARLKMNFKGSVLVGLTLIKRFWKRFDHFRHPDILFDHHNLK